MGYQLVSSKWCTKDKSCDTKPTLPQSNFKSILTHEDITEKSANSCWFFYFFIFYVGKWWYFLPLPCSWEQSEVWNGNNISQWPTSARENNNLKISNGVRYVKDAFWQGRRRWLYGELEPQDFSWYQEHYKQEQGMENLINILISAWVVPYVQHG